jgi:hypothetical protein
VNIDLDTGHPPEPEYVLKVADAFAEAVRVMNLMTMHHEALREPSDADRLIRGISSAVSRLPQLCDQVSRWLAVEQAAGRIQVDGGRDPGAAVTDVQARLKWASVPAAQLQNELDAAASVTSTLAGAETEGG